MLRGRVIAFVVFVASSLTAPAFAQAPSARPVGPAPISASSYILVSLSDDGAVLQSHDPHAHMAPASLTKIVTALVAREQYDLDDVVTASPLVEQVEGSDAGLKPGQKITVRDLLYALLLPSANDAAMALAAHHPNGYEHFIQLMNQKARALGAYDSQFRNPHGLDMDGHYSSPWDMALFARALLGDPVLAKIVATRHHSIAWPQGPPLPLENHNRLLQRFDYVYGVKTGFTERAGHSLVCVAHTSLGDLLTVVMHSNDMYRDTQSLWDRGKQFALGAEAGGGPISSGTVLPAPPRAPAQTIPELAKGPGRDPRDDVRWAGLMLALAVLTVMTLIRRKGHPLAEAAEIHAFVEPLIPRR